MKSLNSNRDAIRRIVISHKTMSPRIFGSVLHVQDKDQSNLDILVDPTPETTSFDLRTIQYELKKLSGVRVRVVTPNSLPDSFREEVLSEAQVI